MIDKIASYILNIDKLEHRTERRRLTKLLDTIAFDVPVQYQCIKIKQSYYLRVQLPKRALPYFVSLLSFHRFSIYQLVRTQQVHTLKPIQELSAHEQHYELVIDGLTDPFIKDKVIDILAEFQSEHLIYTFSQHRLKVTTCPNVMMKLIRTLATRHIDIYYASRPQHTHQQTYIS